MIEANELRLGNWIYDGRSVSRHENVRIPMQVKAIFNKEYEYFYPIPLTEELLVKCGFEKSDNSKHKYEKGDLKFAIYKWDTGLITAETHDCDLCELKYLHQLQNLYYALTNQEITIQL